VSELEAFNHIGKTLTSTLELKQILGTLMDQITRLLQPKNWSMLLMDERTDELYFEIVVGEGSEKIKDLRMKIGEGICGWVARECKPLLIPDVNKDPRFSKKADQVSNFKTEAIACVPMVSKGKVLGVIELINKKAGGNEFTEDDLNILETIADYAAIALENANNYKRIEKLTITDDVTELYNSRYMHQLLESEIRKAKAESSSFSIIFIDLDHFKRVNDTYGHLVGSQLLRELGEIFVRMLSPNYIGTRYGGDEFVLLLPRANKEQALAFAQRLRSTINNHVFLRGFHLDVQVTASFGLATFPQDAKSKDDLVRLADQAMYQVKESTRDNIAVA
jgi:diguanylate cyclase (GGDEF)-like protein